MFHLARSFCLAAALLATLQCAPARSPAPGPDRAPGSRPAEVPPEDLVTPDGYFHPSCVIRLEEGDTVTARGDILQADGVRRTVAACTHDHFDADGTRHAPRESTAASGFDGWVADSDSNASVTPPAQFMSADWVVPSPPSSATGQTLYFFPGLEAAPGVKSILQPVLAWDGYDQAAWTMTNWNCCINGTVYSGKPIPVSSGDQITGTLAGSKCAAGGICSAWKITSTDTTTGASTTFNTKPYGQAFNWYFGGVMEVYGVSTCTQYPADGEIAFTNVLVRDLAGAVVAPVWKTSITSSAPSCGYAVNATTDETVISFRTH